MRTKLAILAATAAACIAAPAQAGVTIYTDQAAFNAAAGLTVTEDFQDGTLLPGLSITTDAGSIGSGRFNDRLVTGSAETTFNFAGPVKAFGGFFDLSPGGEGIGIAISLMPGGSIGTEVPDSYTGQFFGFISDAAFNSVKFTGGSQGGAAETYNLDNLQFGAGAVPEPGTWLLMILGFGAIGYSMRRRPSVKASVSYS